MPNYFSDAPTTLDRRTARTANALQRKRERKIATLKDRKPSRSLPVKKSNPKRKPRPKKETERIYGPVEFRDYLHAHACLGCGYRWKPWDMEQAHVKTGGMSRKDDWTRTGPLCGPHPTPIRSEWNAGMYYATEGCHFAYDHAKRSWRTQAGETFAEAQRKFFAAWKAFAGRGAEDGA